MQDFGSFDEFRKQFETAGNTAFGSGWAWLSWDPKASKLVVDKTIGAGVPLTEGKKPVREFLPLCTRPFVPKQ